MTGRPSHRSKTSRMLKLPRFVSNGSRNIYQFFYLLSFFSFFFSLTDFDFFSFSFLCYRFALDKSSASSASTQTSLQRKATLPPPAPRLPARSARRRPAVLEPKAEAVAAVPRRRTMKPPHLTQRLEMTPPLLLNRPSPREKKTAAPTSRLSMARTLSKAFKAGSYLWEPFSGAHLLYLAV